MEWIWRVFHFHNCFAENISFKVSNSFIILFMLALTDFYVNCSAVHIFLNLKRSKDSLFLKKNPTLYAWKKNEWLIQVLSIFLFTLQSSPFSKLYSFSQNFLCLSFKTFSFVYSSDLEGFWSINTLAFTTDQIDW